MPTMPPPSRVVVGVDTHKDVHAAAVVDVGGALLATASFGADREGYRALIEWAAQFGTVLRFGIEGTGSYGRGLASAVRRHGHEVIEVARPNRQDRHRRGKSDLFDAENAARAVLAGQAEAIPKTADGAVEMIRHLKVAKDAAVKARTAAMQSLKAVLITAPAELRETLQPLPDTALLRRCAALRPGQLTSVTAAAKYSLRAIAQRWHNLHAEITAHEQLLGRLVDQLAPRLTATIGIGPDNASQLLLALGDNPARLHSEAAFAKLCGVCPIPASSGKTVRYRLNRAGHRQANAALHRIVIVRMKYHHPTRAYVARRTTEGKTKPEIMRCLKRHIAREVWTHTKHLRQQPHAHPPTTCHL
ncbi:IS110 family transposase [Mycobacterium kubicae]|uniref:IS110 family transposase n=1 Tax=Mycobacterium kubicae TaxID=120959 RepID=UPI0016414EE0|nr:IS110 family transposase [Mycobacterium kubicae]QNI08330.1 IS110 family transposase [Mycobacterium kubicae]QNI08426.1 IS110 family transposase [Mycobacterium kubicae]